MIKCVIIDDEQPAINVIESYVKKIPTLELVGTATNPLQGIEIIREQKADLVFLDIQMDEMNGIDVMKTIGKDVQVIFCTAYSEFAVESYELDAVDYLMKPVPFDRFAKAVQRVKTSEEELPKAGAAATEEIPNDYLFVKTGQKGRMIKINLEEVDFIEGMSNYVAFHIGKEKVMAYLSMKNIEERLSQNQFVRIHKSYIVSIKRIVSVENGSVIIKGRKDRIPLSSTYKDAFMERVALPQ